MRSRNIILAAVLLVLFSVWVLALSEYAGVTDPTNPPGSTSSYTLENIYNRLNDGTAGTQSTFTEPTSGPGTPTMHTLNEIMDKAPVADNTDGATKAEVAHGKKYWSLRTDGSGGSSWGEETGSLYGGCTCTGTMNGTRWCDNGDGTVTDLTTCLVWLKKADWGGIKPWRNSSTDCSEPDYTCYDDAHTRAGLLCADSLSAGLSDNSVVGDWRLPTKNELYALMQGTEPVNRYNLRAFTGVQDYPYWTSTTFAGGAGVPFAWYVHLFEEVVNFDTEKHLYLYVWPVRGGQ